MDKQKPQANAKQQLNAENDILTYYDLDTVLKIAAKSKQQIARGNCYTIEESYARLLQKRNSLIKK